MQLGSSPGMTSPPSSPSSPSSASIPIRSSARRSTRIHSHIHNFICMPMLMMTLLTAAMMPRCAASLLRNVVVVGGTHGNEYTGVWVVKAMAAAASINSNNLSHSKHLSNLVSLDRGSLKDNYPSLNIAVLLANPEAHKANRRFVETDLNRQFASDVWKDAATTVESKRAKQLSDLLGPKFLADGVTLNEDPATDVVVDLHTTTTNMGVTVIVAQGDTVMTQAAAYVMQHFDDVRCLMHTHPNRSVRPNLSSTGRHGFTIEVGPVPQGVIRHDMVEKTEGVLYCLLSYLEQRNRDADSVLQQLKRHYGGIVVPCFRSAAAQREGEMSGKIVWPTDDDDNPNFPQWMIHKNIQDRDFAHVHTGDPIFIDMEGNVITYNGSHGSPVQLMFINEGGYYYKSSGTGIGVAVQAEYDLVTGMLMDAASAHGATMGDLATAGATARSMREL